MKKIITAINNNIFSEELNKIENIEVINKDIQYKEGILEVLENNKNIDSIIINEKLPGDINFEELIKKIKIINENINIIFILEKENSKLKLILEKNNINNIIFYNELKIKNIINIIEKNNFYNVEKNNLLEKNKNEKNENKKNNIGINNNKINNKKFNLKIIKKIILKNKLNNKLKNENNFNKKLIITVNGKNGIGKTINSILISKYFENKNKKILLVDYKNDINCILGIKNNYLINNYSSNIDIIKLENFIKDNFINYKINYDIIIIDFKNDNYNNEEKIKIIKNADLNLIFMEANLIGIKETKEIIDKLKIILNNNINNLKIIENKINIFSIDKNIIKNCFQEINILGEIKYKKIYNEFINKNFNYNFINKKIKFNEINKEYKKIFEKII